MDKVKAELDRMESAGVIRKVTEPTDWCSPIVPVIKKNGKVRVCIDMTKLNQAVERPHYMLPNLEDIAPKLIKSKFFTTLDASSGFLQIPRDEESAILMTFITPLRRYCCNHIPFGITPGTEEFQRKSSELLQGLKGVHVKMDDVLVHGSTLEEYDARLEAVLNRIWDSGLKLIRTSASSGKHSLRTSATQSVPRESSRSRISSRAFKSYQLPQVSPSCDQLLE